MENQIFQEFALLQANLLMIRYLAPPSIQDSLHKIAIMTLGSLQICKNCCIKWVSSSSEDLLRISYIKHCQIDCLATGFDKMKLKQAIFLANTLPFARYKFHLGRTWATNPVALKPLDETSVAKKRKLLFSNSASSQPIRYRIRFNSKSLHPHFRAQINLNEVRDAHSQLSILNKQYQQSYENQPRVQIPKRSEDLLDAYNLDKTINLTAENKIRKFLGRDVEAEIESFPALFPHGISEYSPPFLFWKRQTSSQMNFSNYARRRILDSDFRFIQNHQYIFLLLTNTLKEKMFKRVNYIFNKDGSIQKAEVAAILRQLDPKEIPHHPSSKRCFSNIPPLEQYFRSQLAKLTSACCQFGPPTLFITFSINEDNFVASCPLLLINSQIWGRNRKQSAVTDENMGLALIHHIQFLIHLLEFVKDDLKSMGLSVLHTCYRIEFQMRGTPHMHLLIWLKDAPIPLDFANSQNVKDVKQQWLNLGDKLITTQKNLLPENLDKVQTHHHRSGKCDQKKDMLCSKEFPKLPMFESTILMPEHDFNPRQYHQSRKMIEAWRSLLTTLKTNFDTSKSHETHFKSWLQAIGLTNVEYLKIIQRSISKPLHFPMRKLSDC